MFRQSVAAALLVLSAVIPLAASPAPTTTQLPRNVRPIHYSVTIVPDAAALTFTGTVEITLEVLEPTTVITLNASRLTLTQARLVGRAEPLPIAQDPKTETATFTLDAPLAKGAYQMEIDYHGPIATQAVGFFAIDYDTPEGKRRALYTKFEPAAARRFIPCFDEPAFRTTFTVVATVPASDMAVSNMPVAQRTELEGGRARVRFLKSPSMSTYLLFFATGEFDRASAMVDGTDVGVITKKGAAGQAQFVLDASVALLREYNDYFAIPYPLPKLDNIAAPGRSQSFSAMENWGAIMSFEYALLLDPRISTEADKQRAFIIASHEISHQWFGDLVTMSWWDDLWLNEGFASWMEGRTTEILHPEWNTRLSTVVARERAMGRDALQTTHPVVTHVETVEQAVHAFDSITYEKGEAVIRMLEGYVGADAWRDGVRRYMKKHAYANTVSDDLWREIEAAAQKPIVAIAHEFTLQPGVPMITVGDGGCRDDRTTVELKQGEFSQDRPEKAPLAWRVPVLVQGEGEPVRALVTQTGRVTVPGCGPVIVNAGQSGYYRTLYQPALLQKIGAGFARIPAIDQLGIISDAWALGAAGYQPPSDALQLALATPPDADPQVWGRIATIFATVNDYYRGEPARRARFREFAVGRLAPVLERLGWVPRAGELDTLAILRSDLIAVLGALGDPGVVAEARRRHAASATDATAMHGSLRKTIMRVVARHADAATWDALHAAAQAEKTPLVKDELYFLLASGEDEALVRRALAIALTDEPGVTTGASMIGTASGLHPDLAFDYALEHMEAVNQRVDVTLRSRYYPQLASRSADPAMIGKVKAFAAAHTDARSRREAETAMASIGYRIKVRRERLPLIDAWLAKTPTAAPLR